MRIRLLGVGVKMGIVDRGHAQSDDVIRCPETFADHEYIDGKDELAGTESSTRKAAHPIHEVPLALVQILPPHHLDRSCLFRLHRRLSVPSLEVM